MMTIIKCMCWSKDIIVKLNLEKEWTNIFLLLLYDQDKHSLNTVFKMTYV